MDRCAVSLPHAHGVHAALPFAALYVPDSHGKHGPPFGPVYPDLHIQALIDVLPMALVVFGEHFTQAELPFTAFHSASPHAWQGPPSGPV